MTKEEKSNKINKYAERFICEINNSIWKKILLLIVSTVMAESSLRKRKLL